MMQLVSVHRSSSSCLQEVLYNVLYCVYSCNKYQNAIFYVKFKCKFCIRQDFYEFLKNTFYFNRKKIICLPFKPASNTTGQYLSLAHLTHTHLEQILQVEIKLLGQKKLFFHYYISYHKFLRDLNYLKPKGLTYIQDFIFFKLFCCILS